MGFSPSFKYSLYYFRNQAERGLGKTKDIVPGPGTYNPEIMDGSQPDKFSSIFMSNLEKIAIPCNNVSPHVVQLESTPVIKIIIQGSCSR